ncbi:hypothetical protein [Cryobacterium sp. Y50]|uniref:hypothetical protein n=1 Tax=Cryobacterium sp. Y50 TaxID=2048286 RepID=UPI000CE55A49|nr:hypothetical protein [Cryobacterium sp. Y50]
MTEDDTTIVNPTEGTLTSTDNAETDVELTALLEAANTALTEKQAALTEGDFAAYGAADDGLAETIASMLALLGE